MGINEEFRSSECGRKNRVGIKSRRFEQVGRRNNERDNVKKISEIRIERNRMGAGVS